MRLVENALVRVFAGRSSRGELLAECAGTACSGRKLVAWCGRLHVQYAANMSISNVTIEAADDDALGGAAAANNASAGDDDALVDDDDDEPDAVESVRARFAPWRNRFSASISYEPGAMARRPSELCWDDPAYALPKEKEEDNTWIVVLFSVGFSFVLLAAVGGYLYWQHVREQREQAARGGSALFGPGSPGGSPGGGGSPTSRRGSNFGAAPKVPHLRHVPMPLMHARNALFLKAKECSICYSDERAFTLPGCGHAICVDCTRTYLQTALGDASMFPVKCPMHHTGCTSTIEDKVARRVLRAPEYRKYIEFHDRAVIGEGINCLKCGCFVNMPENATNPMVQCPYCRYRFCFKCKTPWHPGVRCGERADVELEEWRRLRGAQRCPGCDKIIEKDDPETCNHMVHKASDSMPCLRERTDFCYCCGLEVMPDYPHDEKDNPGARARASQLPPTARV